MTPEQNTLTCPGLPAGWVNAWLAAVGTTVLVSGLRLSWTTDALPVARLNHPDGDPLTQLIRAWPNSQRLHTMPLAREHTGCEHPLERKVPVAAFAERIRATSQHRDAWTLTSTMTDLAVNKDFVTHAPFDPSAPGTAKWLHHRLAKAHSCVTEPSRQIADTLAGLAAPVAGNGLGFDLSRLGEGPMFVHPVVESLSFFGLALLPVRGDGVATRYPSPRQRGWQIDGRRVFLWPAWIQPLDRHGIDALLDAWHSSWRYRKVRNRNKHEWTPDYTAWERLGVHAGWNSTQYTPTARAETNRGFGSRRLAP